MFRKLFALEVAALTADDRDTIHSVNTDADRSEKDVIADLREIFTSRSGNYGSMWSQRRSFG